MLLEGPSWMPSGRKIEDTSERLNYLSRMVEFCLSSKLDDLRDVFSVICEHIGEDTHFPGEWTFEISGYPHVTSVSDSFFRRSEAIDGESNTEFVQIRDDGINENSVNLFLSHLEHLTPSRSDTRLEGVFDF